MIFCVIELHDSTYEKINDVNAINSHKNIQEIIANFLTYFIYIFKITNFV